MCIGYISWSIGHKLTNFATFTNFFILQDYMFFEQNNK